MQTCSINLMYTDTIVNKIIITQLVTLFSSIEESKGGSVMAGSSSPTEKSTGTVCNGDCFCRNQHGYVPNKNFGIKFPLHHYYKDLIFALFSQEIWNADWHRRMAGTPLFLMAIQSFQVSIWLMLFFDTSTGQNSAHKTD